MCHGFRLTKRDDYFLVTFDVISFIGVSKIRRHLALAMSLNHKETEEKNENGLKMKIKQKL